MNKLLVGIVALVFAAGGVAACGKSDTTKGKTTGEKVQTTVDFKLAGTSASSVAGGTQPGVVENTEKLPKFTLILSEGKSGFKFRSALLSEEAKAKIDEMFTGDKFDLQSVHFEIEGYTDNLGSKDMNDQMGLARAKAVKQYLGEYHEIPGDCISVVSYGMEKPVADNSTPEGRARNRRVVIKVVD